jgi:hypoxanthine phosphoribosyltransferase
MKEKKVKHYKSKEGYYFLEKIKITSKTDLKKKTCLDFSYFKFGHKKIFKKNAKLLTQIIKKELGNNINTNNWLIISRSNFMNNKIYGSISHALAEKVCKNLGLKHVISYPEIDVNKSINYSKLDSYKKRQAEIKKRKYYFFSNTIFSLKNKNIIFIDDIINTGITIKTIHKNLKKFNIRKFKVFTVAKLFSKKISYEYDLSRAILTNKKNLKYLEKKFQKSELIITHKLLKILNISLEAF